MRPARRFVAAGFIYLAATPTSEDGFEGLRDVLFAFPEQECRIDVYIKNILNRTRDWDDLERLQGSLLGYEDWETIGGSSNATMSFCFFFRRATICGVVLILFRLNSFAI